MRICLIVKKVLGCIVVSFLVSCSPSSPLIFPAKRTAHEKYFEKIKDAGLAETALGIQWITSSERSLTQPQQINLPYQEAGYFSAAKPAAVAFKFSAKRGERISAVLSIKANGKALVYLDLWEIIPGELKPRLVLAADEESFRIQYNSKTSGEYIIRVQPELLKSVSYNVTISTGPSLAYPLAAPGNNHIKSVWGVDRDGGCKKA